jgi:hypothetical protein
MSKTVLSARTDDFLLFELIAERDQLHRDTPPMGLCEADLKRIQALAGLIDATIPVTLEGVLAMLEFIADDEESELGLTSTTAGLRAIDGSARNDEKGTQIAGTLGGAQPAQVDAFRRAKNELDAALVELHGLADVIRNISDPDLQEVFPYLANQLDAHRDQARDAFVRLLGSTSMRCNWAVLTRW